MVPSSATKAAVSGSSVFFIQKHCCDGSSNTNNIPSCCGMSFRNINPTWRCCGVSATWAVIWYMPVVSVVRCRSSWGVSCAKRAADPSKARADKSDLMVCEAVGIKVQSRLFIVWMIRETCLKAVNRQGSVQKPIRHGERSDGDVLWRAERRIFVMASVARPSILAVRGDGLPRFARRDGDVSWRAQRRICVMASAAKNMCHGERSAAIHLGGARRWTAALRSQRRRCVMASGAKNICHGERSEEYVSWRA